MARKASLTTLAGALCQTSVAGRSLSGTSRGLPFITLQRISPTQWEKSGSWSFEFKQRRQKNVGQFVREFL